KEISKQISGYFADKYTLDGLENKSMLKFEYKHGNDKMYEEKAFFVHGKRITTHNNSDLTTKLAHMRMFTDGGATVVKKLIEAWNSFDDMVFLDIAKRFRSKIYEGVVVNVFKVNNDIYINRINPFMNENSFKKYKTEEAITTLNETLNIDSTNMFSDLLE